MYILTDKYVSGIICDACITNNNQYFGIDL